MKTKMLDRRSFIKYGLASSFIFLSGCSISKKSFALRGIENSFPNEFLDTLPLPWEFVPIKDFESVKEPYNSILKEKSREKGDLLILDDGWISDLSYEALQEIKADKIRSLLDKQANSFISGLGKKYNKKIIPLAVSPWIILFRNRDSLALKNEKSWKVLFSSDLKGQIIFPNSPYFLISIAQKIGSIDYLDKLKSQAKAFDDRNALNWLASGKASAAVLPFSHCIGSLLKDPRLSVTFPQDGSPLNWTVLALPMRSREPFPIDWLEKLWSSTYTGVMLRKGFLPPTNFSDLRRTNRNISKRSHSLFLPEETLWNKCWSFPVLEYEDKINLGLIWGDL